MSTAGNEYIAQKRPRRTAGASSSGEIRSRFAFGVDSSGFRYYP